MQPMPLMQAAWLRSQPLREWLKKATLHMHIKSLDRNDATQKALLILKNLTYRQASTMITLKPRLLKIPWSPPYLDSRI